MENPSKGCSGKERNMENSMDIDFVVLWVDGNDPEWQAEKAKYQGKILDDSNASHRFRDWGLMPYWFRAVEQFCPWVRKVHFVTCGHVPQWLNLDCPKLNHVKHSDYIPGEYLPTFNANTIEMNLHRIPDLSEHFVFFNDDMFVTRPMPETAFFRDGLPCTYGGEVPFAAVGRPGIWQHLMVNDLRVINNHFQKTTQVNLYRKKYINRCCRWQDNVRTLVLEKLFPECFLGFKNLHAPAAFCKSTFVQLWQAEHDLLDQTSAHRFRSSDDVNQWLALWWQVAAGQFSPAVVDNLVSDVTGDSIDTLCRMIRQQRHDMICVNDPSEQVDFEGLSARLNAAFEAILPDKSQFEK